MTVSVAALVEAARLALLEVGQDPALIRPHAGERTKHAPRPIRERIAWHATDVAHTAADGDVAKTFRAVSTLMTTLFSPIAGTSYSRVALAQLPDDAPAIVDGLAKPPRICSAAVAAITVDRSPAALRRLLAADSPRDRILGLRAIPRRDLFKLGRDVVARAIDDADPGVRGEALRHMAIEDEAVRLRMTHAVRERLDDPDTAVRARVLNALRWLRASLDPDRLVARLADADPAVREAALWFGRRLDDATRDRLAGPLVDALRAIARDAGTAPAGTAIYLLGQLGTRAVAAVPDIARALADGNHVNQARGALVAIGALPDDARALLSACCSGPRSDAAAVAAQVLAQLGAPVPEVSIALRVERIANELASPDRARRMSGLNAARALTPADAAPLFPTLTAMRDRLADDPTARPELGAVNRALTALVTPD